MRFCGLFLLLSALTGCLGMPQGVRPVQDFDLQRYLGKWYEIARLDHAFERGLNRVSADYSMKADGSVRVLNSGYAAADGAWKEAEGTARFAAANDQGYLKVSFFGPFYASYVVFELDPDYRYAFVAGNSTDYLWLLARTPAVPNEVLQRFLERSGKLGFDTAGLIMVEQEQ